MVKQGRLTLESEARRDEVEAALFSLGAAITRLDEAALRGQQAIRRTPLVGEVLAPALEQIGAARREIRTARKVLIDLWSRQQNRRWRISNEEALD